MTTIDRIVVKSLAIRDAYFLPTRRFENNANANAWSMRHRYPAAGTPWQSNEVTDAKQQEAHRATEAAEQLGLVRLIRAAGRTTGLQLTSTGEERAASLCGAFLLGDGLGVFEAIKRREAAGVVDVPEDDLIPSLPEWAGGLDRVDALLLVQDLMLPYIVSGFVVAGSTIARNVRYRIVEPVPADFDGWNEADTDLANHSARALYLDTRDAERGRLAAAELIDRGEIGPLPLPVAANDVAQADGWRLSASMAARGE